MPTDRKWKLDSNLEWTNRPLVGPIQGCAATTPCQCVDYPVAHRHWCQRLAMTGHVLCWQHARLERDPDKVHIEPPPRPNAMTDADLLEYLGLGGYPPSTQQGFLRDMSPARRETYEYMAAKEREIRLWQKGLGPEPTDVILCKPCNRGPG